jgi:hypothetical protein
MVVSQVIKPKNGVLRSRYEGINIRQLKISKTRQQLRP